MNRTELLLFMVGASTVNYIGRIAMSVAGPEIARQHQFSEGELGQIFSAFWLGYAIMTWPSGWLADKFGAARVLGLCGLATAALLGANAAVSALAGFLALRLLFGVASAVLYPACGNLSMLSFPAVKIAGVQGLVIGGSNLGAAIAPFFVLWASHSAGWRGAFAAVGLLTLAFFLLWMFRVRVAGHAGDGPRASLRINRTLILLAAQGFFVSYFYSFGDTWSYYYFREVRHFPEEQSALFTTLLQVAGGIAMPLGGWISDLIAPRWGRTYPIVAALAASAALLGVSPLAQCPLWVLALIVAAYSLVVASEGVYSWALLVSTPESPGSAYGFGNGIACGAQFLAPLAFPWIAGRWGWDASVLSATVALAASAVLWRISSPRVGG